jgi:antitoxin VapB
MSLNIKDPETDRLARQLATETGESITVAAKIAIEERLARVRARRGANPGQDLNEIIRRGRARPTADRRTSEEIVGYDEWGLPS